MEVDVLVVVLVVVNVVSDDVFVSGIVGLLGVGLLVVVVSVMIGMVGGFTSNGSLLTNNCFYVIFLTL